MKQNLTRKQVIIRFFSVTGMTCYITGPHSARTKRVWASAD